MTRYDEKFMQRAVELAVEGMHAGDGGPFGAVIVKDGQILSEASNRVLVDNDPTAHAEVTAIRRACAKIGAFQLDDCTVYSSCEPCPMCLGAVYWARPAAVFFGASREDAAVGDFDDSFIYDELAAPMSDRVIPFVHMQTVGAPEVFATWKAKSDRTGY